MQGELIIENNGVLYYPLVIDGVEWSTERSGSAGKLFFKVLKDSKINFQEGNAVRFKWNNENIFYGFVFSKKRDKENIIYVTAYDQLRYLKNKDTYVFENKTATEIIKTISNDFSLQTDVMEDTAYKFETRVEDNTSLFDMITNALSLTTQNTGKMYVLFDNFGKIALKSLDSMKTDVLIDKTVGENLDYVTSIDSDTYNQIKLVYDNEESGERDVYFAKSGDNINKWGVLQYYDTLQKGENGKEKANELLKLYNAKTRQLKFSNLFGRTSVRAGALVTVSINLGDIILSNYLLVEKCTHYFNNDEHRMDLTLRGGEFVS